MWDMIWANLYQIIPAWHVSGPEMRIEVFRRFFEAIVDQCQ